VTPVLLTIHMARRALLFAAASPRVGEAAAARVERIAGDQVDAIWRTARRLGVPALELQDIAQEVMLVVVRRLADIDTGAERAFVVATTARVAANWRRARRRRPEELSDVVDDLAASVAGGHEPSSVLGAEEALERSRKLEILDRALSEMTEPQQVSFIMFELEQMTAKEIARALDQPEAAIVSRVRRAREVFRHCRERAAHSRVAGSPGESRQR
jgi:RNA polymerase sigma-70 factor, ECF subfamily